MRTTHRLAVGLALCLAAVCAQAAPLRAETSTNRALVLGGSDVSPTSTYTSVGIIAPVGHEIDTRGTLVRLWGDRLTYDFISNGQRVGATSWGHSVSIGYQFVDAGGVEAAYAGVDTRNTSLFPAVATVTAGVHTGARFEVDVDRVLTSGFHMNVIASDATATRDYWTRMEAMWDAGGRLKIGPQVVVQGNPDYHGARAGLALENIGLGRNLGASVSVGAQRMNQGTGLFTGLSFTLK